MVIKILQGYEQNINKKQEENEGSTKKFNLKHDDTFHFLKKGLPFSLLNNNSWKVFQQFKISINCLREHLLAHGKL